MRLWRNVEEVLNKYLVVGGSGLLGRSLLRRLGNGGKGTFAGNPFPGGIRFDAGRDKLRDLLVRLAEVPSHVFLLHGVVNPDGCARDPVGTAAINVAGMIGSIEAIWEAGAVPVYMSTDYVFDGRTGMRTEDEPTCASTEYGRQKATVEGWLQRSNKPFLIARSSKIISGELGTHSVLGQLVGDFKTGKPARVAQDQIFTPMHVDDTVEALLHLVVTGQTGLFNVCGTEAISRYDLTMLMKQEIQKIAPHFEINVSACRLAEIPFLETRPLNTSISNAKLRSVLERPFQTLQQICADIAAQHFHQEKRA